MSKHTFAIVSTCMNTLAGIFYLWHGDSARAIYWVCAGVLTVSTIFMK